MKQGTLIFDEYRDRYDIRFDLTEYYGGLHCGDCLEVFTRGKWKPARMEYGNIITICTEEMTSKGENL